MWCGDYYYYYYYHHHVFLPRPCQVRLDTHTHTHTHTHLRVRLILTLFDSCRWCGVGAAGGLVVGVVERACEAWGRLAAAHPARAVGVVLGVVAACSLGLLNLHTEWRHYHLWVPHDSLFAQVCVCVCVCV